MNHLLKPNRLDDDRLLFSMKKLKVELLSNHSKVILQIRNSDVGQ